MNNDIDDSAGVHVSEHLVIKDVETGEIMVDQRRSSTTIETGDEE